jgi:hypothetical protein
MNDKRKSNGQFEKGGHWRAAKAYYSREWCEQEYVTAGRSTGDIAQQFGVTDAAVIFWLRKHGIARRSVSEARAVKSWGASGSDNPMWNKRGELNPRWKGGITPERQSFYTSSAWKTACSAVWTRDDAKCRRCGLDHRESPDMPMHVHHVAGFAVVELRADPDNLLLVCEACHHFIHSKRNVNRDHLQ